MRFVVSYFLGERGRKEREIIGWVGKEVGRILRESGGGENMFKIYYMEQKEQCAATDFVCNPTVVNGGPHRELNSLTGSPHLNSQPVLANCLNDAVNLPALLTLWMISASVKGLQCTGSWETRNLSL